jgi:hypothetical protein
MSNIILVTGGRDYNDRARMRDGLSKYARFYWVLLQGGAPGADKLAHDLWTTEFQRPSITVPAEWGAYGKRAGMIRNQDMIAEWSIETVLAFPGGRGTQDMVNRAREEGIEIVYG